MFFFRLQVVLQVVQKKRTIAFLSTDSGLLLSYSSSKYIKLVLHFKDKIVGTLP